MLNPTAGVSTEPFDHVSSSSGKQNSCVVILVLSSYNHAVWQVKIANENKPSWPPALGSHCSSHHTLASGASMTDLSDSYAVFL